jgi:ankyrin repeat protein
MLACKPGHTDIVALLLAHGCGDIDRRHVLGGWTALHQASRWGLGHADVMRELLGAGADPHVVDRQGWPWQSGITMCSAWQSCR